jgi:hydrogenase maturation protease
MRSTTSSKLLVVGYGNTLRCDDGVGPRIAQTVAGLHLLNVETLACPQLTPELAEPVSHAGRVVFVDAALDGPPEVQLRKLSPADSAQVMAHAADPSIILALARDVFGKAPKAWWLTIPIEQLGIGEELSPLAKAGCSTAIGRIKELSNTTDEMG